MNENVLDDIRAVWREADAEVKRETGRGLGPTLAQAAIATSTLFKAGRHAKRGNYAAALYYVALWQGFCVNINHQALMHHIKSTKD